jgi:hypothetical protein
VVEHHNPTHIEAPSVSERTCLSDAWANQYGKLRWCTERRRVVVEFWLALAWDLPLCAGAGIRPRPRSRRGGRAVPRKPTHLGSPTSSPA